LRSHHTAASWPGKSADKSFNPLTLFRARARRTNGAAVPLYITFASKHRNRRAKNTGKSRRRGHNSLQYP